MTEGWSGGTSDFENTRQAKGIWVKSHNTNYNFTYLKNPQEDFWKIVSEILYDRDFPFILKIVIVCLDKKINKNHTFNRTNNSDPRNYNNDIYIEYIPPIGNRTINLLGHMQRFKQKPTSFCRIILIVI